MLTLGNKLTLNSQPIYRFVNKKSIVFDGADQVIVTDGADTVLQPTTYAFWCKSSTTGGNKGVFGHGGDRNGAFHFNEDGTRPLLWLNNSYYVYWVANTAQDDDKWHQWVVYLDLDITKCKLYCDGVLQTVSAIVGAGVSSPAAYTESLSIGGDKAASGSYFEGQIDEFAVFDRELKQDEITRMYNTYYTPNRVANGNFAQIGNEEVSNGDFSQEGSELVTQGDFPTGTTAWGLGSNWSIANGKASSDGSAANSMSQASTVGIANTNFLVTYTVLEITQGSYRITLGGTSGLARSTVGTYSEYLKAADTDRLRVFATNSAIGSIDNISIKEVGQDWTLGAGTTIENGVANITAASSGSSALSQAGGAFVSGKSFKVSFTISNYSSGSIAVSNLSPTTFRNANGTYTLDAVGAGGDFLFFSSGFVGSVTNITVREVGQNWTLNTGWSIGDGVLNRIAGNNADFALSQTGTPTIGATYRVSFKITSYTTGTNFLTFAGSYLNFSQNAVGDYSYDIVATSTQKIGFYGVTNSEYSLDNIVVQELKSDATNLMLNAGAYQSANPLITSTKSMEFDGVDDYLSVEDNSSLDFVAGFSVSYWVYPQAADSNDRMVCKGTTGSGNWMISFAGGQAIRVYAQDDNGQTADFSSSNTLTLNEWAMVTVVINRTTNYVQVYKNGGNLTEGAATWTGGFNTSIPLTMGVNSSLAGDFDGRMTEVGVWDREITALEVASLYNQGMPTNLLVNRNNYQSGNPTVFNTKQVDFDGTDDFLKVTNAYGSFTGSVSFWVKKVDNAGGQYYFDARADGGVGYIAQFSSSNISAQSGTIYVDGVVSSVVDIGEWHHIVVTGISLNIVSQIIIGTRFNITSEYFYGDMSQIGMWNSTLTANEVSSLYNHGLPVDLNTNQAAYTSSSNLVGYWRMGSGTLDAYPLIADQTNATLSAEYVKNGDFSQEGSELVTNGGFETDSNWTLNTGWSIHEGSGIYGYAESDGTNSPMDQAGILTVGKQYKVEITVTNMTASPLSVRLGSSSSTQILAITSDGTYTAYGTAGADRLRLRSQGFNGRITNVSVKEVLQNWTSAPQAGAYQQLTANGLKMYSGSVAGGSNAMSATSALNLTGTLGKTYKLEVTASDFVSMNSCTIRLNNQYDSNNIITLVDGTQTVYFVAYVDFTFIRFYGGSYEDGVTIKSISIKEVGGSPAIMTNQTASDIENGSPYANVVQNGTFDTDTDWDKKNGSTISGGVGNVIANGDLGNTGANWSLNQDVGMIVGKSYKISFSARQTSGTGNFQVGQAYKIGFSQSITSSFENYTFIITPNAFSGNTGKITIGGATVGNTFEVDSVTVEEVNTGLQGYWKMGDGINDEFPVIYDQTNPTNGAELIPNGTFESNVDGWTTNNANATFTWQTDKTALFTSTSFAYVKLNPLLSLTSGTYKVSFDILSFEGTLSNVHIGLGTSGNIVTTTGSYTYYITASGSTEFQIRPNSGGTGSIKIDNVSVKLVNGNPATMTNMVEGNITNQYPLTKIRNYYRMGDGILDGFPIIQDQTSPNLAHIPTTNLILYSEDLSVMQKVSLGSASAPVTTSNYATAPDGTQTATRVVFNLNGGTSTGDRSLLRQQIPSSLINFYSIYVKSTDGTEQTIIWHDGGEYSQTTVTNEWVRIFYDARINTVYAGIALRGGLGANTSDILAWGFQAEEQTQATAYLKSDGIAAVRKATTTNLITYSEDFSQSVWNARGFTKVGTTTGPNGTSGFEFLENNTNSNPAIVYTPDVSDGTPRTFSVWLKSSSPTSIALATTGSVKTSTINVTTDWQFFQCTDSTNDGQGPHIGGFSTITQGSGIKIFASMPQLEAQTQAETYAPTYGLPVTIDLFTENNYGTMTNMVAGDIVLDTPNNPA